LEAEKQVEKARAQAARLIGASPEEILFTSGTTESNNLALKSLADIYGQTRNHIITQVTEHKSVLEPCRYLQEKGLRVTYLPVDKFGSVCLEDLERSMTDKTLVISIMFANNEIGTIQPIEKIGKIAKKHGVFFHCDAAQAVGKIPVDVEKQQIDLLSFSAHKMYGPKGIGALYIRQRNPRVRITPMIHGGGHEQGLRSGTLNAPAIVGFGKACEIAKEEMAAEATRVRGLRDLLYSRLERELEQIYFNGHPSERLPHNLNLSFGGVDAPSLVKALSEHVAISSGSACTSANPQPSHVLKSLGIREELIHSAIRFGLGRFTTREDIDFTAQHVVEVVNRLRHPSSGIIPKEEAVTWSN
jgi:cysteine desulfurase